MAETDQYNEHDDLPWGAATIPEWWFEVTPHHVVDYNEIEGELRRERAHLARLSERLGSPLSVGGGGGDNKRDDGVLLAETTTNPYSLPGFQPANGIHDASFCLDAATQPRWYITTNGFFYVMEEPDVLHTASQMVESGHLPPGMDEHFGPGWDRARAFSSPVDNKLYAREEQAGWEKPDWLKQKLRNSDQGTAIRHGLFDLEGKVIKQNQPHTGGEDVDNMSALSGEPSLTHSQKIPAKRELHAPPQPPQQQMTLSPSILQTSAEPSNAWKKKQQEAGDLPDWQKKRSEILKAKAAEEVVIEASKEPVRTAPPSPPKALEKKPEKSATAPLSPKPATSSVVSPPWQKKAEDSVSSPVPAWKKKTVANANGSVTTESSASSWKKNQDEASSSIPAWKKKTTTVEESTSSTVPKWQPKATQQNEDESAPTVPTWKKSAPVKEIVPQSTPAVPSWKNKNENETTKPSSSTKETTDRSKIDNNTSQQRPTKPDAPVREPTSRVAAPAPELSKPKNVPTPEPPKQQVSAPAPIQEKAETAKTELDLKAEVLVSQGLVLKLMALPDDSARAKELRNTVAPTPENNNIVLVKPSDLLIAIAYHAQNFKGHADGKEKTDSLRQVAIIARLVIMKLYGTGSPELKQFEDGLRPAFA